MYEFRERRTIIRPEYVARWTTRVYALTGKEITCISITAPQQPMDRSKESSTVAQQTEQPLEQSTTMCFAKYPVPDQGLPQYSQVYPEEMMWAAQREPPSSWVQNQGPARS